MTQKEMSKSTAKPKNVDAPPSQGSKNADAPPSQSSSAAEVPPMMTSDGAAGMGREELEKIRRELQQAGQRLPDRSDDVVGYWVPDDLPIVCIPRAVRLFDSSIDGGKVSALITAEAVTATLIEVTNDKNQKTVKLCKKGDAVGIWYKPGMRAIATCAGVPTYIELTGQKDTGKGNPMKVYTVRAEGGALLPVASDLRKKSIGVQTPFDAGVSASTATADSDIPF